MTDDPTVATGADQVIELPDLTLVPGLMDMEVDLVLGGPGAGLIDPVRIDPVKMALRGVANGQRTLARRVHDRAQPRPVRQDRRLPASTSPSPTPSTPAGSRAPASSPPATPSARPAATSTRARRAAWRPHIMPMSVEEGIADGVDEVRKAVRYQIKHGAKLIKCCASGGVITPTGPPGRAAVLHRGAHRDRRRGPPPRPAGRDPLPTATPPSTPRSTPASTASSTGS